MKFPKILQAVVIALVCSPELYGKTMASNTACLGHRTWRNGPGTDLEVSALRAASQYPKVL